MFAIFTESTSMGRLAKRCRRKRGREGGRGCSQAARGVCPSPLSATALLLDIINQVLVRKWVNPSALHSPRSPHSLADRGPLYILALGHCGRRLKTHGHMVMVPWAFSARLMRPEEERCLKLSDSRTFGLSGFVRLYIQPRMHTNRPVYVLRVTCMKQLLGGGLYVCRTLMVGRGFIPPLCAC